MADLQATAEQFARDLIAQNVGGLMMVFTPNGMMQAMALQQQLAMQGGQPQATGSKVELLGKDGDDSLAEVTLLGAGAAVTLSTRWKEDATGWKIDQIAVKA